MVKNLMSGSKRLRDFFGCLNYKRKFRQAHPEFFDPCGTLIFTGAQGEGKTLSAVQYIIKIAHEYPQSILVTNTWIDPKLFPEGYRIYEYTGLDDLKNYENGYAGVVFFIDEIHLELNSLESKNVDVDIMVEISQQRKQRKHIVGTTQVYGRMAKPLREQIKDVVLCHCFFGFFQFNKYIDAFQSQEQNGKLKAYVKRRSFWFHTARLYASYDTYAKMKRYKQEWQGRPRMEVLT